MKYELPQIIILTDKELMGSISTLSANDSIIRISRCASCGFHVF